jgi:hypothetical protein
MKRIEIVVDFGALVCRELLEGDHTSKVVVIRSITPIKNIVSLSRADSYESSEVIVHLSSGSYLRIPDYEVDDVSKIIWHSRFETQGDE